MPAHDVGCTGEAVSGGAAAANVGRSVARNLAPQEHDSDASMDTYLRRKKLGGYVDAEPMPS